MDRSEAERGAAQPPKTRPRRRESERASWPFRSVTASSAKGARAHRRAVSPSARSALDGPHRGPAPPKNPCFYARTLCEGGKDPCRRAVRSTRGALQPAAARGWDSETGGVHRLRLGGGTYGLWVVLGVHNGQGPVRLTKGEMLLQPGGDGHGAVLLHQNQFKAPFLPVAAPEADGFLPAHDK